MARRMWKSRFMFYNLLWVIPSLLLGLAMLIFPHQTGELFEMHNLLAGGFFIRLAGLGLLFSGLVLFHIRSEPEQNRNLFFWFALLYASLAGLVAMLPLLYELSWFWLALSLYWLLASLFLFGFVSRNLLVRS